MSTPVWMRLRSVVVVGTAALVVASSAACGSSGGGGDESGPPAVDDSDMFAVEVELTWVEELAARVDAGEIGLAEATLFGLRVVAGEEEEPEAPVAMDPHDADELIVGWAYGVEAGADPDADPETLAEISAIMDAILITEEDLLIAAGEMEPPAGTDAGDGAGDGAVEDGDNGGEPEGDEQSLPVGGVGVELAGVQTVEAPVRVGCAKLFPGRVAGRTCIKSDSFDLADGIRLRVWQPEDAPVDLNVGANVRDGSEEVLGFLRGNLELPRAIDVLLIHELSTQDGRADGVATFARTPQRCLVSLDRVSYDAGRVGLLGHELAHCAQAVEFGGHGGMATDWWAEGTAEWVAEQVQPGYATGTDWVRFESFVQSLTTRTYDNWAFFQHWQNTNGGGVDTVFALMKAIAATDSSPDAAVNINGFFDAYTSYVDAWHEGGIASPSGPIPLPEFPEPATTIGARGETRTGTLPPLAMRAVGVEVTQASDDDPAELTFEGDPDTEAVFESDWSTIDEASGSWTFCDPAETHAQDTIVTIGAGQPTTATATIADGDPGRCDDDEDGGVYESESGVYGFYGEPFAPTVYLTARGRPRDGGAELEIQVESCWQRVGGPRCESPPTWALELHDIHEMESSVARCVALAEWQMSYIGAAILDSSWMIATANLPFVLVPGHEAGDPRPWCTVAKDELPQPLEEGYWDKNVGGSEFGVGPNLTCTPQSLPPGYNWLIAGDGECPTIPITPDPGSVPGPAPGGTG